MINTDNEVSHLKNELTQSNMAQSLYKQELEAMKKTTDVCLRLIMVLTAKVTQSEIQSKTVVMASLKSQVDDLKNQLDFTTKEKASIVRSLKNVRVMIHLGTIHKNQWARTSQKGGHRKRPWAIWRFKECCPEKWPCVSETQDQGTRRWIGTSLLTDD